MTTTWKDIYYNLDAREPLQADDKRLYRDLYIGNFLNNIKDYILLNYKKNYKTLLSGHLGCGKSTFLNILADDKDIKNEFHIIKYSMDDVTDPYNDLNHIDILLSIAIKSAESVYFQNYTQDLRKKVEDLAKQLKNLKSIEEISIEEKDAGIKGVLNFFNIFSMYYKNDNNVRRVVREHYTPNIIDFISRINSILAEVQNAVKKPLLILIDDTDKAYPEVGMKTFLINGHHIAKPNANIIYTINIYLATSTNYPSIKSKFQNEEFFPAIKIIEKNGETRVEKNIEMLKELVYKRIPEDFIDNNALEGAITYTGGVVRELIRFLRDSIFNAKGIIRSLHIDYEKYQVLNEYNLRGNDTTVLKNIFQNPDWLKTEGTEKYEDTIMHLISILALFEYRNGEEKWYRPYPIFNDWLNKLILKDKTTPLNV